MMAYRSCEGLTCQLPEFQVGQHLVVSVHDVTDDLSWVCVVPSSYHCFGSTLSVEVPEPCLSEHAFDIIVFACNRVCSEIDEESSTWRGLRVANESYTHLESLRRTAKTTEFPAWDCRRTCLNSLQVRKPHLSVHSRSYWQAIVTWRPLSPLRLQTGQWSWLVTVANCHDDTEKYLFLVSSGHHHLELPGWLLKPSSTYKIAVCGLSVSELDNDAVADGFWLSEYAIVSHEAVLSRADLAELFDRAMEYSDRSTFVKCLWLYRNKSQQYFEHITHFTDGIMETYLKDLSGDPASPINGRLPGLFFLTSPDVDGQPPKTSQFGPVRLQVPTPVMLELFPNCYFTDFYCMNGRTHYITLAMTRPGSEADEFCLERGLLPLDLIDNPFFVRRHDGYYINASLLLQIELYFTEDLDINDLIGRTAARITRVRTIGRGSSTPGGIPKNPECGLCNLPRPDK